jgi:acyl dehydratase
MNAHKEKKKKTSVVCITHALPSSFHVLQGRMAAHVYPGDTLETRMWVMPQRPGTPASWTRIVFHTVARTPGEEEERLVITGGAVEVGPVMEGGRAKL